MNFFKRLFGKKVKPKEFSTEEWERHYEEKQIGLEKILGKMNDLVGHAIIPFDIGGTVDMYYFLNSPFPGTAFATMELIQPDGSGPIPNKNGTYELIAFTKELFNNNENTAFSLIERRICGIFTIIGFYSSQAKLQPGETCELPYEGEPNRCVIFSEYKPDGKDFEIGKSKHNLLLVMEVFRDEMEYSRENGSVELMKKLKEKGVYPYSDLNRESVLK